MDERFGVARRFAAAVSEAEVDLGAGIELLPHRLTVAARDSLGVAAASLSLHDRDSWTPIGVSDELAAKAQRLQFTAGSGPAVDVARTGRFVAAGVQDIPWRWSPLVSDLFRDTPIRALVSLPVVIEPNWEMTLDLYLAEPGVDGVRVSDLADVGEIVAQELLHRVDPDSAQTWLAGPEALLRSGVWVVLGRLSDTGLSFADALDLVRARALALGGDVDEVAALVLAGRIDVADLLP